MVPPTTQHRRSELVIHILHQRKHTLLRKLTLLLLLLLWGYGALRAQKTADTLKPFTIRATYYSDIFVGRRTSSGEIFRQNAFTAAHNSLPLGTLLLVTNMETGSQVIVRINDRCPRPGILDLTKRAARTLGIGSKTVEARVLPQHYKTLWKRQEMQNGTTLKEHLTDLLRDTACFADPAGAASATKPPSRTPANKGDRKNRDKNANAAHSGSTAKAVKNTADSTTVFYYLDLATAPSRREAEDMIERRLPMKYQNECVVKPDGRTSRHRIILDVRLTEQEGIQMKKEMKKYFPSCELRKTIKND